MKKKLVIMNAKRKLLLRFLRDVLGIGIAVFVRCVWKPFHLPNPIAMILSLLAILALLYDIVQVIATYFWDYLDTEDDQKQLDDEMGSRNGDDARK